MPQEYNCHYEDWWIYLLSIMRLSPIGFSWLQKYVTSEIRFWCQLYLKHNFIFTCYMCKSGRKLMGSHYMLETVEQPCHIPVNSKWPWTQAYDYRATDWGIPTLVDVEVPELTIVLYGGKQSIPKKTFTHLSVSQYYVSSFSILLNPTYLSMH